MGSSEITFICGDKRVILTVTYKGGGGGSILFHQASWDPIFVADIDPEAPLDLRQLLSDKVRSRRTHLDLHLAANTFQGCEPQAWSRDVQNVRCNAICIGERQWIPCLLRGL